MCLGTSFVVNSNKMDKAIKESNKDNNIINVAKVTWQNFLSSNKEFRFESNLHNDQLVF